MHREVVGPHFGWQVKHFNLLWIAGARCNAAGFRLPLHGRRSMVHIDPILRGRCKTWCTRTQCCVAGVARWHCCRFSESTFACNWIFPLIFFISDFLHPSCSPLDLPTSRIFSGYAISAPNIVKTSVSKLLFDGTKVSKFWKKSKQTWKHQTLPYTQVFLVEFTLNNSAHMGNSWAVEKTFSCVCS